MDLSDPPPPYYSPSTFHVGSSIPSPSQPNSGNGKTKAEMMMEFNVPNYVHPGNGMNNAGTSNFSPPQGMNNAGTYNFSPTATQGMNNAGATSNFMAAPGWNITGTGNLMALAVPRINSVGANFMAALGMNNTGASANFMAAPGMNNAGTSANFMAAPGMNNPGTSANFVVSTPVVVGGPRAYTCSQTPYPISVNCPHCKTIVITQLIPSTGCFTHLAAAFLCLMGLGCCFCIPYFVDSIKDMEHHCPQCGSLLGVYERSSDLMGGRRRY